MSILDELESIKSIEPVEGVKDIGKALDPRTRNTRIIDLVEGDVLVNGDEYQKVAWGEISIGADGTIDTSNGELVPVSIEALTLGFTGTIFNMEDI